MKNAKNTHSTGAENSIWLALVTLILPVLILTGCADHRISLSDFLILEQQQFEASATTEIAEAQAATHSLLDRRLGPYQLGPSDVLQVTLTGLELGSPLPSIPVRVDRNGKIDLPAVGEVSVGGLELEDVEDAIRKSYVPNVYRDVVVHVAMMEAHTTNVLVHGAVTLPGMIRLPRSERNLLFAITSAGGISELASGKVTLRRLRRPTEEITLDLTCPEGLKAALSLDLLENGDILHVQAAMPNMIFVGGLVNAPQTQAYPAGVKMTILQALAASGGLRTDVIPRQATLIRRLPDGKDIQVKLNLNRIATGKDPNIFLAAGDVLWVPETLETKIHDFVNRNFYLRAGMSINYNVSGVEYLNRRSLQGGRSGGGLQDQFDPFGFLTQNALLQAFVP